MTNLQQDPSHISHFLLLRFPPHINERIILFLGFNPKSDYDIGLFSLLNTFAGLKQTISNILSVWILIHPENSNNHLKSKSLKKLRYVTDSTFVVTLTNEVFLPVDGNQPIYSYPLIFDINNFLNTWLPNGLRMAIDPEMFVKRLFLGKTRFDPLRIHVFQVEQPRKKHYFDVDEYLINELDNYIDRRAVERRMKITRIISNYDPIFTVETQEQLAQRRNFRFFREGYIMEEIRGLPYPYNQMKMKISDYFIGDDEMETPLKYTVYFEERFHLAKTNPYHEMCEILASPKTGFW